MKILKRSKVHLRLDATYFEQFCLLCYQDHEDGYTQLIRVTDGEHYFEIKEDLDNLIQLVSKLKVLPQTDIKVYSGPLENPFRCTDPTLPDPYPKNVFAMADAVSKAPGRCGAKSLVLMLLRIKTENDRLYWTGELQLWYRRHEAYLKEKTFHEPTGRYWYTHKLLRRSYFTIKRALPKMFHYQSNPKIPSTTNGIEGFFSHLKNHPDLHRGLTLQHRIDFIKWYVYLSNDK